MKRDSRLYKGPVAWMARHGVAPNLLMAFLIVGGFIMSLVIRKEFIPPWESDRINVSVAYPGATPAEVEQAIVLPVENEISSFEGIKEINSTASQGSGQVRVELENGVDKQLLYQDIQQAVSRISTLPVQAERPVVSIPGHSIEVAEIALFGPLTEFELKRYAEYVRQELLLVDEISKIEMRSLPDEEIHIEIQDADLRRYGITLSQVASLISNNAIEQSAGSIKTRAGEILVTLNDRRYWAREFRNIPLIQDDTGVTVLLGDVATIREDFEDISRLVTYNGEPAVRFDIFRSENQTPVTVVEGMHKKLDELRKQLPHGMQLLVTDDDGKTYEQRLGLLLKNAGIGLFLVLILLSIFLEYRLAFWVTMGIPTAFLGALLFLPIFDVSINMVSMFAFIVALGIVVDDAIIAGENIYEHMQKGIPFMEAAILGAREVAVPLAFAILTNIAAFLPLLALPGFIGKLFIAIPIVVMCCFAISWVEALFILPTHLASLKKKPEFETGRTLDRIQEKADAKLSRFIKEKYRPVLDAGLKHPLIVLVIATTIAAIVMAVPLSGRMGFSMFPRLEGEYVVAIVNLHSNAPQTQGPEVRSFLESKLREVTDPVEAESGPLIVSVEGDVNDTTIEVEARLVDSEDRALSSNEIVKRWREAIGEIPGIRSLTFDAERGGGPSGGAGMTVELRGSDNEVLRKASDWLSGEMKQLSGVADIASSDTSGKPQLDVELTDAGRALGLISSDVASQVRAALFGARALRQQRGSNEVTVLVRLPEEERINIADVESLHIRTPAGGYVPLREVAVLKETLSPGRIIRRDGQKVISVTSEIEPRRLIPGVRTVLSEEIFPEMKQLFPGVEAGFRGRQSDTDETLHNLMLYGGCSLLLIYMLLALPFRSYSQPLLVMAIIPFGAVGAISGHLMLGEDLSVMSLMGIVALAGVVVNDSLILVDYANRRRKEGATALEAIRDAGERRFRPILLTTLTTFGGLAPMVFETSRQAQFITPMAVSLGFGILFTTFVCLLILPALYIMQARFGEWIIHQKTASQFRN